MRRQKANVCDLDKIGVEWYDFHRCKRIKGDKVLKGTRYSLVQPMTEQQEEYLSQFKNVRVGIAQYRYAPEIQHQTIILFDKCL